MQKLVRGDYNSSSPPSSTPTPDSSAVSAQSVRQKTDPAWVHVTEAKFNDGKRLLICNFCEKVIKGGGIHRMKKHLAGQKGDVGPCKSAPPDVRFRMQQSLNEFARQKLERQINSEEENPFTSNAHENRG